jgi:hypothetical protein
MGASSHPLQLLSRKTRRWCLLALGAVLWPAVLNAQWLDAQLPRRGELQVGISGQNLTVDERFAPDGSIRPLSEVFAVQLDARLVPALDTLDTTLADVFASLELPAPEASNLGVFRHDVLFERTRAPISLAFGVSDWLAAFAVIPIVKGKSFVGSALDSLTVSAGPAASAFGPDADAFFTGLSDGIASLESAVLADTLPPDLQAQAEALLADAHNWEAGLTSLRGLEYMPTDSSEAGRELTGRYEELRGGFQEFELELPALSLSRAISVNEALLLSSGEGFGIEPIQGRSSGIKLGDIELGVSLQPFNTFRRRPDQTSARFPIRARLDALWRLASGSPPRPERLMDLGVGDGQPDLEFRSTLDVGYGRRIWLSLFAGYNLQLETTSERLISSPAAPIQLGAYVARVNWDPGDVLTLAAAPRLNLTRNITFSALFLLRRRGEDRVTAADGSPPDTAGFQPTDTQTGSEYTARSLGFAARYASTDWTGDRRRGIPAEVELRYLQTNSARDGFAPKGSVWQVALRLYGVLFR